jgi:hypothetical protein
MNVLRSKRAVAGLGAAVLTIVGLTLFVVLPALASNSGDRIPPAASPSGLIPVDVPLGGNGTCSNIFTSAVSGLPSLHEYDNVNPGTATGLSSGNGDGVKFNLTLSGPNQKQVLLLGSTNAAIAAVGIKGGSESAAYDYTGREFTPGVTPKWVTGDGNLHAPASKYTVSGGMENPTQWYGISQMTVCYRVLAPISGAVFNDANSSGSPAGQNGLDGVTVTLVDNTTGYQTMATTANGGKFSFNQPVGDSYTVCSASPAGYQQTAPTTGAACTGGLKGYTYPVPSTGSTANNFGFRPLGSVAGTVFNDVNQNLANDDGSPLSGWTVTLYGGAQPLSTTSNADGSYKINAAFSTSTNYTLCETPPSGAWAQDVPLPSSTTICGPNKNGNGASGVPNELLKGLQFTPGTVGATITGQDFGNVAAVTCNPDGTVPSPPGYDVNLPPSTCSTTGTKSHTGFVVDSGFEIDGTPFVSVWTGDSLGAKVPLLEHINFPDALNADGTLKYTHLVYTDPFPFTGTPQTMPACKVDPRSSSDPTQLSSSPVDYTNSDNAGAVLPTGATSCVISLTTSGTVASGGSLDAEVYSDVDGLRQPG